MKEIKKKEKKIIKKKVDIINIFAQNIDCGYMLD